MAGVLLHSRCSAHSDWLMLQPEGVRRELLSGGRLDPQGLYGTAAGACRAVGPRPLLGCRVLLL